MANDLRLLGALTLAGAALVVPAAAADNEPVTVDVTADTSGSSTRLVLTHSEPIVYAIQEGRGKIRVFYTRPVELRPDEQELDAPALARYRTRGRSTVILHTGDRFTHYETFELRNPFRVVIDFQARPPAPEETPYELPARRSSKRIVVIDPGHGGVEQGAVGPTGLEEKEVTLDLARRLRRHLQRTERSISVVLTRDEDRLVGLDERTAIANHNRAELFISLHLNAAKRRSASGAETYYLSTRATDDEARILAALENSATGSNGNEGGERRNLDLVLWDLAQNTHLSESSALADSVQQQLNALTGTRNRGVRQAPFRVLMGATMPAVLVEVGFISNPSEEKKFRSPEYRNQVVQAVAQAVRTFLDNLDRLSRPR